jgi:hypothetical protein
MSSVQNRNGPRSCAGLPCATGIWDNAVLPPREAAGWAFVVRAWRVPVFGGSVTERSVTGNCLDSVGDASSCRLRDQATGQYCSILERKFGRGIAGYYSGVAMEDGAAKAIALRIVAARRFILGIIRYSRISDLDSGPWLDLKGAPIVTARSKGMSPRIPGSEKKVPLLAQRGTPSERKIVKRANANKQSLFEPQGVDATIRLVADWHGKQWRGQKD